MKLKYFIFAAIFLCNPVINTIDILPDFLGYYFVLRAFTPPSYIFDNASDLYDAIKRMIVISTSKFFCAFLIFVTDATMALVLSFTFGILEILYGLGMVIKLFDVTSYIRLRYDDTVSTASAEKIKRASMVFLIARAVFALLPDLTALTVGNSELKTDLTRFRPILFMASALVILIWGIIWAVKFVGFFRSTLTPSMLEKIDDEYTVTKRQRPGIFESRDFMFAIKLIGIGVLFSFDMSFDSVNYFLDGIFVVFCIIAFRFLIKKGYIGISRREKTIFTVCAAHITVNLTNFILTTRFFINEDPYYVYRDTQMLLKYLPIEILSAAESVLFFVIIYQIFKAFEEYTVPNIRKYSYYFAERSVDGFVDEYVYNSRRLSLTAKVVCIISLVYFVFYTCIRPLDEAFAVGNYLFTIAFIITFKRALGYISDRVYLTVFRYS